MAVSFSGLFWLSVVLLGIGGVANVGLFVPSITMFQETPPTPDKGRLIALRSGFGQLGLAAGLVVGGLVGAEIGITQAFFVAGAASIVLGLLIYIPYRLGASRRARSAWSAATQAGATRSTARNLAHEAAYNGAVTTSGGLGSPGAGAVAWAAAAEAATASGRSDRPGGSMKDSHDRRAVGPTREARRRAAPRPAPKPWLRSGRRVPGAAAAAGAAGELLPAWAASP